MVSSPNGSPRIVIDNIHGDIELSEEEWRVVNTATFQRLRSLKQLGMGHLVYPNATHTRFAHSLGVFRIMCRVLAQLERQSTKPAKLKKESADLRLAALLHDIGHYPYSHLMERIDRVQLTEEEVSQGGSLKATIDKKPYPDHEALGREILVSQTDICDALGGHERAKRIGAIFSRLETANPQLSKLIHSSLDMDRLDYLMRDSRAAGVPYGEIDLNYLLNNIRVSPKGMLGVDNKALAAAEHFLLARMFMHRVVYYHKTTYAFEEACRQLLRRVRDSGRYSEDLPVDGPAVLELCGGSGLRSFTDDFVDRIVHKAVDDADLVIRTLAGCITHRRPPRLLVEVSGLQKKGEAFTAGSFFRERCRTGLQALADRHGLQVGQFLLCGPKPIKVEERGSLLTRNEAEDLKPEEREELIMVFEPGSDEPRSIIDINQSLIQHLADHPFAIHRLYLADIAPDSEKRFAAIRQEVRKWTKPNS